MFLPIIAGMFTFVVANFLADKVADVITGAITEDDPEWRENDADFDKAVLHSATSVATYTVTSSVLNAALGAHPAVAVAGMVLHTTYAIARAADHARSLDLELEGEASWSTTYARPHSTTGGGSAATSEPAQPTMQTQAQSSATVGGGGSSADPWLQFCKWRLWLQQWRRTGRPSPNVLRATQLHLGDGNVAHVVLAECCAFSTAPVKA
ncbi:hypothetical protein AM1111 [Anaplasma marginale str. St. Maries]|uniref:hypothetical protein n=1 Tax=Anaplasma marginale TaxID=770 RepID=UPI0000497D35|nr:hypothetical protein [Anaplasma marginale]AAV86963.1 hypothetical protein AM1111 [Anaplasma marginale str. St. Maries]